MIEARETSPGAAAVGRGWATSVSDLAMSAARDELAALAAQLNDGHARLVALVRRVLADELWCGAGLKSPEHWLTAYAGLTWSSAHDIVRIAERSTDLPAMQTLLDSGRLSLGQAAVVAKHTPAAYDADVAEFASYTTVTQLRRALCRYDFQLDDAANTDAAEEAGSVVLHGTDADDDDLVDIASDAAQQRAPGAFDPVTAPPTLDMRYVEGRFRLSYDAPADLGALVEQALLEAKDTLFRLHTTTSDSPCGDNAGTAAKTHHGASFGEAMSLMAQRSLDDGAPLGHSRAGRYRVYLHLDTQGHGWLTKGSAVPPALLDRVLCDGVLQPIWETECKPVNVGRAQRIVPDRTRRLLEDRDRGCRFPGCLARHHLECHHLDHWIDGGRTDADRMVMLCPFHHDEHHRGAFVMVGDPSSPAGVVFTARDGTRLRSEFRPYRPAVGGSGAAPDWAPYAGPTNETLHLALVRFDERPATELPDG